MWKSCCDFLKNYSQYNFFFHSPRLAVSNTDKVSLPPPPQPPQLVMDFMIRLRESVRVVQFAKKSRSFVRSFSRVSGSGESFTESFRLSSSLRPSFSFANRECQPSPGQTRLLPHSQHSNESRMHNAVLTAESVSVRLPRSHFLNKSRNHDSQSCNGANGANGYQSTQH